MQDYSTTKGKHLTQAECIQIERWHNRDRLSNREIAYRLNKAPQTIHNELKRGLFQLKFKTKYSAHLAQKHMKIPKNAVVVIVNQQDILISESL